MKKAFNIITDILLVVFILLAALITIVSLNTKDRGVTNIFGYVPLNIQTNSMQNVINPGDLIFTQKYNGEDIEVGDIIAFFSVEEETTIIKTHRVIRKENNDGTITFITKGDNAEGEDQLGLTKNDIVSIYQSNDYNGFKLPFVGNIFSFLKSQTGFLFCIILPLFVFFIYQLYKFIVIIMEEKKKETLKEIEAAKEKA